MSSVTQIASHKTRREDRSASTFALPSQEVKGMIGFWRKWNSGKQRTSAERNRLLKLIAQCHLAASTLIRPLVKRDANLDRSIEARLTPWCSPIQELQSRLPGRFVSLAETAVPAVEAAERFQTCLPRQKLAPGYEECLPRDCSHSRSNE